MSTLSPPARLAPQQANRPIATAVESVQRELSTMNTNLAELCELLRTFLALDDLRRRMDQWETEERLGLKHHSKLPTEEH